MSGVLLVAGAVLLVAALLLVVRMTLGPTILDRSVSLDVLVAVTVCSVALHTAHTGATHALPVLLVLAGCGFVGAVSVARYASRSDDLSPGGDHDPEDVPRRTGGRRGGQGGQQGGGRR